MNDITACKCGAPLYTTKNDWSGAFCKACGWSPSDDRTNKIREQIAWLYDLADTSPENDAHKCANTMEKLLTVYEVADKLNDSIKRHSGLGGALAAVQPGQEEK